MLRVNAFRSRKPLQEERSSRWMGSEATFLRARAMILLPVKRMPVRGAGRVATASIGTEQLLRACRESGLKSKG